MSVHRGDAPARADGSFMRDPTEAEHQAMMRAIDELSAAIALMPRTR
jgi:hypothetical protein